MAKKRFSHSFCPCHSGLYYHVCCQPWHDGDVPPTAVSLMRARYSAYALGKVRFVMQTTHPQSPHRVDNMQQWRKDLKNFCQRTEFVGLRILHESVDEPMATVTFHAILTQQKQDASYVEQSLFEKINGRYYYLRKMEEPSKM